jgi:general secretion pathway protein C
MQINEQVLEWAPRVAFVGSVLLAASAAAHLTGTLITPAPAVPADRSAGAGGAVQRVAYDHAGRILLAKLMGEAPKVAPLVRPAQVPETRLNLKLIGVLATGGESGIAIIADSSGVEKMYAVGARIPGGAVLRQVLADRVLLQGPTGLETLRLFDPTQGENGSLRPPVPSYGGTASPSRVVPPDNNGGWGSSRHRRHSAFGTYPVGAPGGMRDAAGQSRSGYPVPMLSAPGAAAPGMRSAASVTGQTSSSNAPMSLSTSDLGQLREQVVSNPALLAGMVNAKEVVNSGQVVGYQLNFNTSSPAISALGLQSGDVVTQVNGIPLTSPAQGLRALTVLSSASQVNATVMRSGQLIQVNGSF